MYVNNEVVVVTVTMVAEIVAFKVSGFRNSKQPVNKRVRPLSRIEDVLWTRRRSGPESRDTKSPGADLGNRDPEPDDRSLNKENVFVGINSK